MSRLRTSPFFGVLAFVFAAGTTAAPHPELGKLRVDAWSVGDYAARSHQNWDARIDREGLPWFGNSGGVQVFDGARFRLIETPHSTIVYSFLPADDGRVYLGTTSDIGYLEPDANADWRYVSLLHGRDDIPPFGNIFAVQRTTDGVFFRAREVLFRYRPATGRLTWVLPRVRFQRSVVAAGTLYLADAETGITRFADDRLIPVLDKTAFGDATFRLIATDHQGRLLVLTTAGLFVRDGGTLRRLPTEVDDWLASQSPYIVTPLGKGILAITSRHDGVVLIDDRGRLLASVSERNGLRWPWVTDLTVDHQGGLWASQEGGISRIEIDGSITSFDDDLGVHSVEALTRHRGRLVAATTVGLKQLIPAASSLEQARFAPLAADGTQTWSLLDDGDTLLFGDRTGVGSLHLGADGSARVERVHASMRAVNLSRSPLDEGTVFAALEDGVARLRRLGGRWRSDGKLRGVDVPVMFVEQAPDGALWLGTINGTYRRVRSLAGWPDAEVEHFAQEAGVPRGNAHLFRAGGELRFGTFAGFYRFDGARFEPDPAFPPALTDGSHNIHRLREGPDGRLWLHGASVSGVVTATADGRWQWDRAPLQRMPRENVSAVHIDDDSIVWLGGRRGVTRFDPDRWRPPAPLPQARVRRVEAPGTAAPLFGGAVPSAAFEIPDLPPELDALRISFAVADFTPPRALEYRTRLEGVDRDWTPWTPEAQRDFTSLPPGRLTFQVEARNSLGQTASEGHLRLHRLPPWYRTGWAIAGYGLAALALLAGTAGWTAQRRTARLELKRRRLESLVEERTAAMRRQAEALAAEHEAKSRFFTNVSHELRTPLTLTLGPLEDAAGGRLGPLPETLAPSIGIALRNARQLRNLVDQVLDVGRLEAGRMPIAAAAGDVGALVGRVADRFAVAAERAGLVLDTRGIAPGAEAWFDPTHLERVVGNLLSNALKFTPAGGRVTVRVTARDEAVEIAVADTGVGIAADDLPRIFDRYFQADGTVAQQPGTGIGLALVRELVALHGGTVDAVSEPNRGTTLRVTIPRGRDHLPADAIAAAPAPPDASEVVASASPGSPADEAAAIATSEVEEADEPALGPDATTLLIVDDNAELRGFLRRRFAGRYRVIEAADGIEALACCRARTPDLVIADVMMPRMDGFELTRTLKADPDLDFVPVLLLTARAGTEDAVKGLGVGADDYLRKPFDDAELEARVERLIASLRRLRARFAAPEPIAGLEGADATFDRRLLTAIEHQLEAGELSVQALADRMAMDRSHLYRRVQAVRGVSPQALILKVRLQAAARMLAASEGSVSEVAYGVGFASLSHFSDSFRRHFGLAPSKWRRQAHSLEA